MFEQLVAEAAGVILTGWDFGWLEGRAAGPNPSWSYPAAARELVRDSESLLDVDTGGGEMLASLGPRPGRVTAVEGWAPNLPVARERLGPLGVEVLFAPDAALPLDDDSVDLVLDRHGRLDAGEIARVLAAGGRLLTQQVGSDDCAELNEALGVPQGLECRGRGGRAQRGRPHGDRRPAGVADLHVLRHRGRPRPTPRR